MALQKQSVNMSFGQGLDTKTDPNQVQLGKFLSLQNAVFNNAGLLSKRNGFKPLPNPSGTQTVLGTQNGNLVSLGSSLQSYSPDTNQWLTKGAFKEVTLTVDSLVRTTTSQTTVDIAVGPNGSALSVYEDSGGYSYYSVFDINTGLQILPAVQLPGNATLPRVEIQANNFIVTYLITISGITHLQYIAVPVYSPSTPYAAADLAIDVKSLTAGYDTFSSNNNIYFAYWSSAGTNSVKVAYLNQSLIVSSSLSIAGQQANLMSITVDQNPISNSNSVVYVTFYNASNNNTYTAIYDFTINTQIRAPSVVLASTVINQLTGYSDSDVTNIYYQVTNTYSYSSVRSDFVEHNTITYAGVVSSFTVIKRSVGLASQAFIYQGTSYVMVNYGGSYQPTYYLIDQNGNIIAQLAYSNGIQYASTYILPNPNVVGSTVSLGYLIRDLLAPVNKDVNALVTSIPGVYAQTGINLASFTFNDGAAESADIAHSMNITSGFLWMFDGVNVVENNFFVYPEDLSASYSTGGGMADQLYNYQVTYEWTDADGNIHRSAPSVPLSIDLTLATASPVTFTGNFASGDYTMTVSSTTGLFIGQKITDTSHSGYLQADTIITAINTGTNTITFNLPTTHASSGGGDTIQTSDNHSVTLNIPTLRLTYKSAPNNARIVVYRWSVANPVFYQVTSITNPIVNNPAVDSITFTDTANDNAILGNLILYTTGGVLENASPPACSNPTLYRGRLWVVDGENHNNLWYSKQVIQATPVEFSQYQTFYVAPTIGTQGSTGPITALSTMDDKLIIFKQNAIYYINGNGPDATGANNDFSDPIIITSTVGCDNQNSIVFTPQGLMFQSNKGIWVLGRDLSTNYIGAPVEAYNSNLVQSSVNVPGTNQVRFSLDNQLTLVYDYYYNQWGTFNVNSLSSVVFQNKHTYLTVFTQVVNGVTTQYSKVYQENPGSYLDGSVPVLMSFQTSWVNVAGLQGFERAYYFLMLGTYKSPHTLTLGIAYDYNPAILQQTIIKPTNYSPAWGGDVAWGTGTPWGGPGTVEQWRVFLQRQKCESFQINFQENYDPSYGVAAGAGLTLSGLNLVIGVKGGYYKVSASQSAG